MKTFKVVVDGQAYTVQVEEVKGESSSKGEEAIKKAEPPKPSTTENYAAVPAGPEAPKEEVIKETKSESSEKPETKTAPPAGGISLKAPMPGSVLEVRVSEGDKVEEGDVLLILEAMKMENELTASQAGTVEKLLVNKGDTVENDQTLIILT
ncbi:MAG: biotin/lipoyl-containing protein [Bacillota bacterium]